MRDDGSLDEGKRTHVYGPVSWFLEKAMATHSSVLAWRIPGGRGGWSLVGCCLWGHTESDTTEAT